jgi:hypothetical protein
MSKYEDGTNSTEDGDGKYTAKCSQPHPPVYGTIIKQDVKKAEMCGWRAITFR